mgnify:CR=1 FL=1
MSVYKVIEIIGRSKKLWEDAAASAVETTAKTLEDIRIAEVKELDMKVDKGKVIEYRAKLSVSFKYDKERMLEDRATVLKGKRSLE